MGDHSGAYARSPRPIRCQVSAKATLMNIACGFVNIGREITGASLSSSSLKLNCLGALVFSNH